MLKKALIALIVFLVSLGIFTTVAFAEEKKCNAKIIIIGAGIAGLGAAHELYSEGCDVTVLEAKDKIGGRIDTDDKTWHGIAIDKHASWISGTDGNPITTFAEKFHIKTVPTDYECYDKTITVYDAGGHKISKSVYDEMQSVYQEFVGFRSGVLYKILDGKGNYDIQNKTSIGDFANTFLTFNSVQPTAKNLFKNEIDNNLHNGWSGDTKSFNITTPSGDCNTVDYKKYKAMQNLLYKFQGFIEGRNYDFVLNTTKYATYNQVPLQDIVEEFIKQKNLSDEQRKQFEYSINWNIENDYAADASDLSFLHYDEVGYLIGDEFKTEERVFPDGYGQIIDRLSDDLVKAKIIHTKQAVVKVQYDNHGVKVTTNSSQVFEGDYAIVTLPLGVLKKGSVEFDPQLPDWKKGAIDRLGVGTLNKAYFLFDKAFWDDVDWINYIPNEHGKWLDFLNLNRTHHQPILLALNPGKFGKEMEYSSKENVTDAAMKVLDTIYKNNPKPVDMIMTKSWSNEFVQGSYSYIPVNSNNTDYDKLAKPVNSVDGHNRVLFAGEATTKYSSGLTHGAYLTGLREVNRINYMILNNTLPSPHEQQIHTPVILKGMENSVKEWKIFPEYVFCKEGQELIAGGTPQNGYRAACVSHHTATSLTDRAWAFSLDYSP